MSVSITLKSTRKLFRNQHNYKDILPSPEFQHNLEENFSLLSNGLKLLINKLAQLDSRFSTIYLSQSTLGAMIGGYSRGHINKMLKELERLGLIRLLYRHTQTSCYRISSIFRDSSIRARLAYIFNALKTFHISMLFSTRDVLSHVEESLAEVTSEKMLHNIKCIKSLYIIPSVVRETLYAGARRTGRDFQKNRVRSEVLLPTEKKLILEQLSRGERPDNWPSQVIKNISIIPLSRLGQIKLCAFPDFIITKAVNEMKTFRNPRDPYALLFSKCMKLCKEHEVVPEYSWVDQLKKTLKLDDSMSPTVIPSVQPDRPNQTVAEMLKTQYKEERPNFDRSSSFREAAEIMRSMPELNQFQRMFLKMNDHDQSS